MGRNFDKQRWLDEKQKKLADAQTALEDGLKALQTDDDWKAMLRSMAVVGQGRGFTKDWRRLGIANLE